MCSGVDFTGMVSSLICKAARGRLSRGAAELVRSIMLDVYTYCSVAGDFIAHDIRGVGGLSLPLIVPRRCGSLVSFEVEGDSIVVELSGCRYVLRCSLQ